MVTHRESESDREFVVRYGASETVFASDMVWRDARPRRVDPADVGRFAVQRFLDGSGPGLITVDVREPGGVTHTIDVYLDGRRVVL